MIKYEFFNLINRNSKMVNWDEWMRDVYESLHEDPHAGEDVENVRGGRNLEDSPYGDDEDED